MSQPVKPIQKQRGAVAIIVGITIAVLIVMVGLVVDLGYLYTRKTELQNAADAAALAGARELNGTASGITAARDQAIALAVANGVDFGGNPVSIADEEIRFGPTPDGPWDTVAVSQAAPADKRFIEVDTSGIVQGSHPTWFMRVAGFDTTSTFGRAVAGPNIVDIAPIAACALDSADCPPGGTGNCGYRKGQSYKLGEINPIGSGTLYWINPITTDAGECSGTGSTDFTLPFVCQGKVTANVAAAPQVLTNTGVSTPQLAALDSRFDDYPSSAHCDPVTAPPDTNIKEYPYDNADVASWMNPIPTAYVSPIHGDVCNGPQDECQAARVGTISGGVIPTDSGGVVWSFVRPEDSPLVTGRTPTLSYPGTGTPYTQTSGDFFAAPTHTATAGRRILTLMIVDCPTTGGNCRPATVRTRARFLMQRKAISPGDNDIYIEFGGTVGVAGITAEYKLYR